MTAKILAFKLRDRPNREQALGWLTINSVNFPNEMFATIGPELFYGWRFILSLEMDIYFADCIHPGINIEDLRQFQNATHGYIN